MKVQPIIVIGMHRSGTTMLTKILEKLGIFMGHIKEENNESIFFLNWNDKLLNYCNASWEEPENYFFICKKKLNMLVNITKLYLISPYRQIYFGKNQFLNFFNLNFPWGWKDPRNSILLNVWLKIFKHPIIIHIYRNPIDVAESLRKRALKLEKSIKNYSSKVKSIDYGIKLWFTYIKSIENYKKIYNLNIFEIKYEDFLRNTILILKNLINFLKNFKINIEIDKFKYNLITQFIKPTNAYKFTQSDFLISIYKKIKDDELIKIYGYDSILC